MALDSTSSRTRSITAIGAGAVLFAVIGYFFLSKNRKKSKKKSRHSSSFENMQSILETSKTLQQVQGKVNLNTTSLNSNLNEIVNVKELEKMEENLSNPIEASSPYMLNNDKFFSSEKPTMQEIFEITIEKTTEKNLIIDLSNISIKEDNKIENDNQIVPEKENSSELKEKEHELEFKQEEESNFTKSSPSQSSSTSTLEISSESANLSTTSGSPVCVEKFIEKPEENKIENLIESFNEIPAVNPTNNEEKSDVKVTKRINEKSVIKKTKSQNKQQIEKKSEPIPNSATKQPKKSKSTTQNLNKVANNEMPVKNNVPKSHTTETLSTKKSENSEKAFQDLVVYEFNFPRKLCGKLIGKNGVHVDYIRSKTHTQIAVRNDPSVEEQQILCVSGLLEDVDHALDIIRARFPAKHYPQISFKPISKPIIYRRYNCEKSSFNGPKVLVAPNMFVDAKDVSKTKDGLIDVYVSSVVSPTHVFLQLPKNVTFSNLVKLDENMLHVYNNPDERIPLMLEPIEYGSICAAPTSYGWHRTMVTSYISRNQILETNPNYSDSCGIATIKFLDYGGYLEIPANQLRQLRSDFMVLPFQALECYLDGISSYEGTEEEGKQFLTNMVRSSNLKARITGYYEGLSGIRLYLYNDLYDGLDINSELVNHNYAYSYSSNDLSLSKTNYEELQQIVPQSL
ncbi:unnamed protein product [Brachionus calyciflorus]|uniref:Tudor domain-containing protein n=1 Tax=Brachionus calyciflorus TaxID=104777 RepID=A0A813TDE4_9BILA|nr:unnamed protein product [Brachionus calyciflorus]